MIKNHNRVRNRAMAIKMSIENRVLAQSPNQLKLWVF